MTVCNSVRIAGVVFAACLCAASAGSTRPKASHGPARTERTGVFYTPKPRFEWPHRHGQAYRVVLWRVPTAIGESRTLVYDRVNYLDATWSPSNELDFATRYELFVYDEALRIVTSWAFTIGFQPATIMFPAPGASVRSLLPEIRIRPFEHPHVYYGFEVSDTQRFERIIDSGYLAHADSIKTFPGADDKLGTRDDIKYVAWPIAKALSPDKRYWYRVRGYHFTADELANRATAPAKADAVGTSEKIGSFTIPAQTGSETLANITQLTRDTSETAAPALSKHLELSFVSMLPARGAEIRVARAQLQRGVPTFDSAREEFTSSVRGSSDVWPQWDIDGEGMFFASDRAGGASNIWYKRRDTRGYTQLTFHEQTAWYPSLSKDGSKVAYQVQNNQSASGWSVWVIARDGRSATELGSGEQPRWSPDGKKIAFAQRDARG
ncbi:MAG TPA: hypothetical protein VK427_00125, partial [Kofleriaceae bacterium]|nr:hypothetical protein [Kofleriaceae bacterium]